MHPADITAALKRKGFSQAAVGTACAVGRGVANAVVRGVGRSKKVEDKVSEITGVPLAELWPQWYGEPGGGVQVQGEGNMVAGRDQVGVRQETPQYGAKLSIAEERWLRLLRALEPAQQEEVEKFMRQKIAGG